MQHKPTRKPAKAKPAAKGETKPKRPAQGERVIEMMKRADGATTQQIMDELGILAHSARALISVHSRRAGLKAHLDHQTGQYKVAA